jgi:hypothetical protein
MIYVNDFIPFFAPAGGWWRQPVRQRPLLGHLRQARNIYANGRVLIVLSQERCGPHPRRVSRSQRVRCRRCAASGELHQIWWFARSNPTSCAQVSKRLVSYVEGLLVLSPYWKPSDTRIAAIADAHFITALASLNILPDVDFKAGWQVLPSLWFRRTRGRRGRRS